MKFKSLRLMMLVPMALAALQAGADQSSDIAGIEKAYSALKAGIVRKDMKAIMALCTSDFSWVDPKGHAMSRGDFQKMRTGQFAMKGLKFTKMSMKNDSYGFMGNECAVRCSSDMSMSALMNGKTMTMRGVTESVDTWRRTPQGWKMCRVQVTHETQQYGG